MSSLKNLNIFSVCEHNKALYY